MNEQAEKQTMETETVKSSSPAAQALRPMQFNLYSAPALGQCLAWPRDPWAMAMLMMLSPEHSRCCHIKAHGVAGNGVSGKGVAAFARLLQDGDVGGFLTQLQLHLEGFGNAFVQKIHAAGREGRRLVGLRLLPPATMFRSGPAGFVQVAYQTDGAELITRFDGSEIQHIREVDALGMSYAVPSWYAVEGMAELADAAVRYNRSFFDNSAVPDTAVIFEGFTPDKDSKEEVRGYFQREFKGIDNARRTMILSMPDGGKIHFEQLAQQVRDGDFLKLLDAMRDRIILAHGVPPRMLGVMAAGQLGGGGEVTGQLFVFEKLTLVPRRTRLLSQIGPLLKEAGIPEGAIKLEAMDITPPAGDQQQPAPTDPAMQKSDRIGTLAAKLAED